MNRNGWEMDGRALRSCAALWTAALLAAATPALNGCQKTPPVADGSADAARAADAALAESAMPASAPIAVSLISVQSQELPDNAAGATVSGSVVAVREAIVAAEAAERVVDLRVQNGDFVRAGQPIARLDDRIAVAALADAIAAGAQLSAQKRQLQAERARAAIETRARIDGANARKRQADASWNASRAAVDVATSTAQKTRDFTRNQEKIQAQAALRKAIADESLAQLEHARYAQLVADGAVSTQTLDRVKNTLDAASAATEAARQTLSLAEEGARREDIAAADASKRQADAAATASFGARDEARSSVLSSSTRAFQLESLDRQIDAIDAARTRADAAIEQAKVALKKRTVLVPFSGRVLEKRTELGETLAPGAPIVRLADLSEIKATFAIPEAIRPQLLPGQRVKLTADALPGRVFSGVVATGGFGADTRARTFSLEIRVKNPGETLLPGMALRLSLPNVKQSAGRPSASPLVPIASVVHDGQTAAVFLVENGRAVRREIDLGPVSGDRVRVVSGLSGGARIVASPDRLTDGAPVRVLGETLATGAFAKNAVVRKEGNR